ncbi:MAG: MFS transporter [Solirubrobacteraceae bacterium]
MTATRIGSVVPRGSRHVFGFLLTALLVETLFFVVLSPLLPVYARELHLGRVAAGVMSASYAIGYGLAAIPAGAIVGRTGDRRVSLGGLMLVGLSCTAFGTVHNVVALDAARTITGVGAAAVWAGSIPWLVSLGGEGARGRLIGLAFSAASAGACAGPAVGALATITGPEPVFLVLGILIVALGFAGMRASAGAGSGGRSRSPRSSLSARALGRAIGAAGARPAIAMVALPSVAFGAIGVLLPLRLRGLGVAETGIASGFLIAALLEIVANALVGRWFDHSGGARVLRVTLIASTACLAAMALPLPAWLLLVALIASLPVIGSVWVPALATLSDVVERHGSQPGVALGLFNLTWAVCQITGAVGGAQLSALGEAVPLNLMALLCAAGAVAAARLRAAAGSQRRA